MDFGLGESLKMVEEDWGKKPRRFLSFLIGILIASVSIHFIYGWLILPIYHAVVFVTGDHSLYELMRHQAVNVILTVVVSLALVAAGVELLRRWYKRRIDEVHQEADKYLGLALQKCEERIAILKEEVNRIEQSDTGREHVKKRLTEFTK